MTLFQVSSRARSIKMVDDRLAELVRSYPILYDKSLVDFKNAYKKELAWNEIARKLSLKSGKQKHESNWVCLLDQWSLKWSKLYFCCIHILICSFWIPFLTMLTPFIVHNVLLHILRVVHTFRFKFKNDSHCACVCRWCEHSFAYGWAYLTSGNQA